MARFVRELAAIQKSGVQVVLVSSGAIAAGMGELGWKKRPGDLAKKQAAAAVGQPRLMEAYRAVFPPPRSERRPGAPHARRF